MLSIISCFKHSRAASSSSENEGKTELFDLPNELLLLLAERMDSESRRRFSKTCRELYYFIRTQTKYEHFHTLKEVNSIEIYDQENCQVTFVRSNDAKSTILFTFVSYPKEYTRNRIRKEVKSFVISKGAALKGMKLRQSERIDHGTRTFLDEILPYFMAEKVVYYLEKKCKYHLTFAEKLFKIHPNCSFVISNGFDARILSETVFEILLTSRLNCDVYPWAMNSSRHFEMCISESRDEDTSKPEFCIRSSELFDDLTFRCSEAKVEHEQKNMFAFNETMSFDQDHREFCVRINKSDVPRKHSYDFFAKCFPSRFYLF